MGGLGKFSHGNVGLSHHHWVEQVNSAGSFGVHCMRLSSQRVRHFRPNLTQKSMLDYLRRHTLFEALLQIQTPPPVHNTGCQQDISVLLPLQCHSSYVLMGHDLENERRQQ